MCIDVWVDVHGRGESIVVSPWPLSLSLYCEGGGGGGSATCKAAEDFDILAESCSSSSPALIA